MKGLPAIWFALILLALLALLTFWIDRTVQPPAPKRDGSTRHDPDYTVSNFTSYRTDPDGIPQYSLAGAEMKHYPDTDTTELLRPFFTQYSLKNSTIRVRGDRGLISPNGENVYFMDNVKIVREATPTKGELTVLTEYLHIIPNQGFVQTDKPVTILQAPRTVIRGTGMELYKKERILKLFKRVKVHYERPDAPPAPPLTIEQIAGKPAPAAPSKSNMQGGANAAKPGAIKPTTMPKKPVADNKKTGKTKTARAGSGRARVKETASSTGKTKTRIRRHYANIAN